MCSTPSGDGGFAVTDRTPTHVLYVDSVSWFDPELEAYVDRVVAFDWPERCPSCGSEEVRRSPASEPSWSAWLWTCRWCRRAFTPGSDG